MTSISDNYPQKLAEALQTQLEWLKTSELPRLKEEVCSFQNAFSTLYGYFLKKGIVSKDSYEPLETQGEMQLPEAKAFSKSKEQLSIRLASYDKQLDLLANSYQFTMQLFTLERVRRIRSLISYINWAQLSIDTEDVNTRTVAELVVTARRTGDVTTQSIVTGVLNTLMSKTSSINRSLNTIQKYNREMYKLELRKLVLSDMKSNPSLNMVKQKAAQAMPKSLFYPELVEEVLKEDYSLEGVAARVDVLEKLKIVPEEKIEPVKKIVLKTFLLEGIQAIRSIASTLEEIWTKFDENERLLAKQHKTVWEKLRRLWMRVFAPRSIADEDIYEIKYVDSESGSLVHKQVKFHDFMFDLEANAKNCASIVEDTEADTESQLLETLERQIQEIQKCHQILTGLDDYFKSESHEDIRNQVKGVKPELSTIKNALVKANEQRAEYLTQMNKVVVQSQPETSPE